MLGLACLFRSGPAGIGRQARVLAVVAAGTVFGLSVVVAGIGGLNNAYYGRFTAVETKSSEFQAAMVALQRVGATYHRAFLPVPKAAREAIYEVSPSFARLRPYLDPANGQHHGASIFCMLFQELQGTCGDLPAGWFLWTLRFAAAKAGMYATAETAAEFYRAVASEVETACTKGELQCISWLPPLIPAITGSQWRLFPDAVLRGAWLLAYDPPPTFRRVGSALDSPDSADAVEFLNRPYGVKLMGSSGNETRSRDWIRTIWIKLLEAATVLGRYVVIGGLVAAGVAALVQPVIIFSPLFLIPVAMTAAAAFRVLGLALIDITSFPVINYSYLAPVSPLLNVAGVLFIYLLGRILRSRTHAIDVGKSDSLSRHSSPGSPNRS
jgi:hypothetical protein